MEDVCILKHYWMIFFFLKSFPIPFVGLRTMVIQFVRFLRQGFFVVIYPKRSLWFEYEPDNSLRNEWTSQGWGENPFTWSIRCLFINIYYCTLNIKWICRVDQCYLISSSPSNCYDICAHDSWCILNLDGQNYQLKK